MKTHITIRQFSRFLSYILGRRPFEFGLVLDEKGFVPLQTLLKAIHEENEWKHVRESHFHEILLRESDPPIELEGNRIRSVDRIHAPKHLITNELPKLLYVCIRQRAHTHTIEKGISPTTYQQVILSSEKEMAIRIGRRSDSNPILLTVQCDKCKSHGIVFYHVGGTLFTAGHIPPGSFTGPASDLERIHKSRITEPVVQPKKEPGSFILEIQKENPMLPKARGRKKEIPWKKYRKRFQKDTTYPG